MKREKKSIFISLWPTTSLYSRISAPQTADCVLIIYNLTIYQVLKINFYIRKKIFLFLFLFLFHVIFVSKLTSFLTSVQFDSGVNAFFVVLNLIWKSWSKFTEKSLCPFSSFDLTILNSFIATEVCVWYSKLITI